MKPFRTALAALLVGAICLSPVAAVGDEPLPADLPLPKALSLSQPSDWAAEEVAAAQEAGLVSEELTQNYQALITRRQFAGLAVNLIETATGGKIPVAAMDTFSDCTDVGVRKAYAVGIIDGISPGIFSPDQPITREQLAVILAGALEEVQTQTKKTIPTRTADLSFYVDGPSVSSWASADFSWLVGCGLLRGTSDTLLSPQANCTVEQAILLTQRSYDMALTGKLPTLAFQKTQGELARLLEIRASGTLVQQLFADLDSNGTRELAGAFRYPDGRWEVWFAGSDGNGTRKLLDSTQTYYYPDCQLTLLPQADGTSHLAIGFTSQAGLSGTIYQLSNGVLSPLLADQPMTFLTGSQPGDVICQVQATDGYRESSGAMTGLTNKTGYLYFAGETYHEYALEEITQTEFLSYTGGAQALSTLRATLVQSALLELTFYRQANGMLHVQCDAHDSDGGVGYLYYSYVTQDNVILETLGFTKGQLAPCLS